MNHNETDLDKWEENYKPIDNPINRSSGWDGKVFETYGKELEYILNQDPKKVWTWWDTDGGTEIVAGYHLVNRIGYFVTENSWNNLTEFYNVDAGMGDE